MNHAKLNSGDTVMKEGDSNISGQAQENASSHEANATASAAANAFSTCKRSRTMIVIERQTTIEGSTSKETTKTLIVDRSDQRDHADGGADDRSCYFCRVLFKSKKALCGQMKTHPDKSWKGVRPPSNFCPTSDVAARVASAPATAKRPGSRKSPRSSSCGNADAAQSSSEKETVKALLLLVGDRSSKEVERTWHEFSKCGRVFATEQSLGGHMRSHYRANATESGNVKFQFDLNVLPEMEEA